MALPLDEKLVPAARAMRAEGLAIYAIAKALHVHRTRIAPVVRDIEYKPPVTAVMSPERVQLKERARAMRKAGASTRVIAHALDVHRARISEWVQGISVDEGQAAAPKRRWQSIPRWVRKADLTTDYLDFRKIYGEFGACRECRRLLAEARIG